MIGAINSSKSPFKVIAVIYLALYQIFLFSFIQLEISEASKKSEIFCSQNNVSFSELDSSRPLDISKNETQKEHEVNSFTIEHSTKFIPANEVPGFLRKVFTTLKPNGAYFNSPVEISETPPRSPPLLFS